MPLIRKLNHAIMRSLPSGLRQRVVNGSLEYLQESAYHSLRRRGFLPGGIIDIGAFVGSWAKEIAQVFPATPVLMVEPQANKRRALDLVASRLLGSVETVLLGDVEGREVDFYEMETGSSIYPENSDAKRAKTTLKMTTLDTILRAHPELRQPLFIKIDAQGAEIDILNGASRALSRAELVQLEVALMPYNKGAPTAYDVFDFMRQRGFSILEFAGVGRKNGTLVQSDMIFAKSDSKLRQAFFQSDRT